jgi:hypothetical protein
MRTASCLQQVAVQVVQYGSVGACIQAHAFGRCTLESEFVIIQLILFWAPGELCGRTPSDVAALESGLMCTDCRRGAFRTSDPLPVRLCS